MQLCSKHQGARGIELETFRRRGQLLSCPPTTGQFGLIVGVPCILCSLALPGVWSFLRVTHLMFNGCTAVMRTGRAIDTSVSRPLAGRFMYPISFTPSMGCDGYCVQVRCVWHPDYRVHAGKSLYTCVICALEYLMRLGFSHVEGYCVFCVC